MVLEYPANHTFWLFSEPPKEKKAAWNSKFMWPHFFDGHYFRTWEKILVSGLPIEKSYYLGDFFFLLNSCRLSGMWTLKCHLFICAHEHQQNKSNKNQTVGNESIMEDSAPDYVLGRCNYEKYHCDTSCHILRMTISSCCQTNTDLVWVCVKDEWLEKILIGRKSCW